MYTCRTSAFFLLIGLFLLAQPLSAQLRKSYDGPYISRKDGLLEVKWIQKGKRKKLEIPAADAGLWTVEGLPAVDLSELSFRSDNQFEYRNVEKFAAISDIHGQYDLMRRLFRTHGVIDSTGNWAYGTGHLVILGDVFDRGDKVTECLWFIFFLQKQAEAAGGKVHFLLGNHELMVMHGDKTYINPKYIYTAGKLRTDYAELFSEGTVLGDWLRSRKISISINDIVFVHGGFSRRVIDRESSIGRLNRIFQDRIIPDPGITPDTTDLVSELYFENGPLWYRRYAQPYNFDIEQAEYILGKLGKETIVIGHTSMPQIISLYGNRIILIDSSIKFGKTGEMLMYENELLYRAKYNGERLVLLSSSENVQDKSLFEYLLEVTSDDIDLVIETEFDSLVANKEEELYQDAVLTVYESKEELYKLEGRIRSRGNMRKKLCEIPPLKLDFNKKNLRSYGFSSSDKIKMVLPCLRGEENEDYLKKELLIYQLYQLIDTLGLRTKLVNVRFEQSNDSIRVFPVLLIEDENQLAARIDGDVIDRGVIQPQALKRDAYLKMVFFQFMIANSDWSVSSRHNILVVKHSQEERLIPVPYDFDYAGIVNQEYAYSARDFPRMSLDNRKLRIRQLDEGELEEITEFYQSIRSDIFSIIDGADYMSRSGRQSFRGGIEEFYRILENPSRIPAYLPDVRIR